MRCTFRTIIIPIIMLLTALAAVAQESPVVTLDSCRNMALRNNKQLQITSEQQRGASYQRKAARAAYLPSLDATGLYLYNQKEISLLESDQMLPTMSFNPQTGSYGYNLVTGANGQPVMVNGQPVPSQVAVIPKSAMTFDVQNVFAGAVTLTQPIYMGGKIRAMNEMTRYAEQLAAASHNMAMAEVICNVDAAYWQVVSLKAKYHLAKDYVNLLDTLSRHVDAMLAEGVATRADQLSVAVKLNEANVDLTKVENGLALSRMALAQVCGLPLNGTFTLADEDKELEITQLPARNYDMDEVYDRRNELQSIQAAVKIYEAKAKVERSAMLPNLAIMGMYSITNPNLFNGFEKKFDGMFSVGAVLKIPLWHWGGNYNKYRSAKSESVVRRLQLEDAREKVELQVSQASFKAQESIKTYTMTRSNLAKAEENLRQAQLGFDEGVMTADDVMTAQTAWLKANSENIDAQIDVQLCNVYLSKALGTLVPSQVIE